MFNLDITHTGDNMYNEIPQANPLRWQIMYRQKNVLSSQAHKMKCRDFFNDLVAKYVNNSTFEVYRFNNKDIKFNKFGLYFLLTNVHNADEYIQNVQKTLIPKLKEQLGANLRIYKQSDDSVVVRIPPVVWTKTYYVSLVTIALRLCNYNCQYESWEQMFASKNPAFNADQALNAETLKYVREKGFDLPDSIKQYWFYCGNEYNSKNSDAKEVTTIVHNNGVRNWVMYMKMTGAV